jgi:hypothetical protein
MQKALWLLCRRLLPHSAITSILMGLQGRQWRCLSGMFQEWGLLRTVRQVTIMRDLVAVFGCLFLATECWKPSAPVP